MALSATADSTTRGRLHAVAPTGYEEDCGLAAKVYESLHVVAAFERAADVDVLSNQFDFLPLTYSRLVPDDGFSWGAPQLLHHPVAV